MLKHAQNRYEGKPHEFKTIAVKLKYRDVDEFSFAARMGVFALSSFIRKSLNKKNNEITFYINIRTPTYTGAGSTHWKLYEYLYMIHYIQNIFRAFSTYCDTLVTSQVSPSIGNEVNNVRLESMQGRAALAEW